MILTYEQKIEYALGNLNESMENLNASNIDKKSIEYCSLVYNLTMLTKMFKEFSVDRVNRV